MKKSINLLLIISLLLTACSFNQSAEKDLKTGAYMRGNGIGVEDVYIEVNDVNHQINKYHYNDKVNIKFEEISGLKENDGKTYPEMGMKIVENGDKIIADFKDLLNLKDGTEMYPLTLNAYFNITKVFKPKTKYTLYIKIKDAKSDGIYTYEMPFTVE